MKKLPDGCRCLGQDSDTEELCPEREECGRYIVMKGACSGDLVLVTTMWLDGKCAYKTKRKGYSNEPT